MDNYLQVEGGTTGPSHSSSRSASPARQPPQQHKHSANVKKSTDGSLIGGSRGVKKSPLPRKKLDVSTSGSQEEAVGATDDSDMLDLPLPTSNTVSNGSGDLHPSPIPTTTWYIDDPDSGFLGTPDGQTAQAIQNLLTKISKTKEMIKMEQTIRDENVNEYLKVAPNADKQQLIRIKTLFEKKNQKSSQTILQLQKKLESYSKKIRELETYGHSGHRQPKEVLRDVGQGLKNVGGNIKDGITGFSGSVMSKPKEFAHLIKNKFGSADNINNLSKLETDSIDDEKPHHGSATLPPNMVLNATATGAVASGSSSGTMASAAAAAALGATGMSTMKFPSDEGSECTHSSVTSGSGAAGNLTHMSSPHVVPQSSSSYMETMLRDLQDRKEENERLREEMEQMKQQFSLDLSYLSHALQEERFRYERLEEQTNDLTELHQNEMENLKQGIKDMEEKVQYQSEERLSDLSEMLENCQTRISQMEHQQQQQQQYVNLEGIENSNFRAIVVKLINILLTILQVILLLVATAAGIIMPFLKTRFRTLSTSFLIIIVVAVVRQWPDVKEFIVDHYKKVSMK